MTCNCSNLQLVFDGKRREDIPELSNLTELKTDFKTWATIFSCNSCGQKWEEKYENRGHGEVPTVRKI